MRTAVTALGLTLALACVAPAAASVRIEKTVVVHPAPHGGFRPGGALEPGQSPQQTDVRLPDGVGPCEWSLVDPRTGRFPGDPFTGQGWRMILAGLLGKRHWALIVNVVNSNTTSTRETPRRWRLVLRCSTARHPACWMQPVRPPYPHDYVLVSFSCRRASSRFEVTVPEGYGVRQIFGVDNALLHETIDCAVRERTIKCRGRTPAYTATLLGFFLTKPVRRGLPLVLEVPRAPATRVKTRSLNVRF